VVQLFDHVTEPAADAEDRYLAYLVLPDQGLPTSGPTKGMLRRAFVGVGCGTGRELDDVLVDV
jgi:hypothetical protein